MKVGIVVPYSWSYWGGVVDHAEEQARALASLGIETRLLIGCDPPGRLSRLLHPRSGRHEPLPDHLIALGRSVITPANDSLANVVLSPAAIHRVKQALIRERFDILHIHEPLTPIIGVAALAYASVPVVATFHAAGSSRWRAIAAAAWGFLLDRIDVRIAVSAAAARASRAYAPGRYRLLPNGVPLPEIGDDRERDNTVVFVGRHEARKGLAVLLRAWPAVHAQTGARLHVIGAEPPLVRLLLTRQHLDDEGIDLLGPLPNSLLEAELRKARLLVAPSLGGESFGMVLTRACAAGVPVVASDIDGYRDIVTPDTGWLVPPGEPAALAAAICSLLSDERRRRTLGANARAFVADRYAWPRLARELAAVYQGLLSASQPRPAMHVSGSPHLCKAP